MKKIFTCLAIFVLFALVVSTSVSENFANAGAMENATVNITIELTPDAHRNITIHAEIPTTFSSQVFNVFNNASVQLNISSPAPGQLQVTGNCSVTFSQPVNSSIENIITQIATAYLMPPSMLDSMIQQSLENYIATAQETYLGLATLQLENFSITSFSWQSPTLGASATMRMSSEIFENQQLRDKLPINISGSLNISATEIKLRIEGNNENANGWLELDMTNNTLTIDAFLSLPSEVIGENVNTDVGSNLPLNFENLENKLENLENQFEGVHITTTLIVPDGSNIENLQPGYTQNGNSYTWSGKNAIDAIVGTITGQPLASVSYKYVPSSSTWLIIAVLIAIIVPIAIAGIILWRRR